MESTTEKLEKITGTTQLPPSADQMVTSEASEAVKAVLSDTERIERNKDKLDLKPGVDFVDANIERYRTGMSTLLTRDKSKSGIALAERTAFTGTDDIVEPQVDPNEAKKLLEVMPESLASLSMLEEISYHTFGNVKKIPVPGYDDEGNFDPSKVELVSVDEFPRPQDHPTRILVGVSTGTKIFPTPIPKTVSGNPEAIKMYQLHVFLHEFFHTLEYKRRSPEERSKIQLEADGQKFTFQEWWEAFEELLLSGIEPGAISSYAETYSHQLNKEFAEQEPGKFTTAVGEQICETFVAYMLGTISNNDGWTDFKGESFGNVGQLQKYTEGNAKAANLKWVLMDKLCRAGVVSK